MSECRRRTFFAWPHALRGDMPCEATYPARRQKAAVSPKETLPPDVICAGWKLVLRRAGGLEWDFLAISVDELAVFEAVAFAEAFDVLFADNPVRTGDEHRLVV
ncbi:hypothetical protein ABIE35_002850 [Paenarthrobacter sp. 4246]